jgi:hypothetical protein
MIQNVLLSGFCQVALSSLDATSLDEAPDNFRTSESEVRFQPSNSRDLFEVNAGQTKYVGPYEAVDRQIKSEIHVMRMG